MPTILITGGSGFIGSHLTDRLLKENHTVIVIDNFSTGKKSNLAHQKNNPRLTVIEHDITDQVQLDEKIDFIFHLASPASPVDYANRPIETLDTGSIGTKNILELARKNSSRFLLASTSEIYGDPLEHPQKETYYGNVNSLGPRSCYDEAKRYAEALSMAYYRIHKTDVVIARIFNTYGPRMRPDDGRVVPNFIIQAQNNQPITIYGDGSQTRSFCYVDDLVDGLIRLAFSYVRAEAVNIGNPDERTIKEFASSIISITGSSSEIRYLPLPENDPLKRKPDITKAEKLLGWNPKTSLIQGLEKTIMYFEEQRKNR